MQAFQLGQLSPAVDAKHFPFRRRMAGNDPLPFSGGHADDISQVVLTLRILVVQPRQPASQLAGGQTEDAGIDFIDCQLFRAGIFLFDDAFNLAARIAHDAAITGWIGQMHGEQGDRSFARNQRHFLQGFRAGQRHIAVKNQAQRCGVEMWHGLLYRVPRTQLRLLLRPGQIRTCNGVWQHFPTMAIDHANGFRAELIRSGQHMRNQWLTG